jgi:eukaryotic-like serine/threonine-protein kinase
MGSIALPRPPADEVFLWDLFSPRRYARVDGLADRHVHDLVFGIAGRHLFEITWIDGEHTQFGLWDVATDPVHPRLEWRRPTSLTRVPITGDRTIVAVEEPGQRFVVRDLATGKDRGRIGPVNHDYDFVVPSPDGRLLAVGRGSPYMITLWDVAAGKEKARFDNPDARLWSIAFSPDSRYLALDRAHGEIEVRDLVTNAVRTVTPPVPEPHPSTVFAFSPDSRYFATNVRPTFGDTQPTTIWLLDPWRLVATYPGELKLTELLEFSSDGPSLIQVIGESLIRWNFLPRAEPEQPTGHADEAWSLAFSPDGSILASGSDDTDKPETIKLWDVATGRMVRGWYAGAGTVAALTFDPRGQFLASAHLNKPGEVRLWDPATGQLLAALSGHIDFVRAVAFNPDGTILASAGSDRTIRLWNVAARKCIRVLNGHTNNVRQVAFSPDGAMLVSGSNDFTVRLWNVATGALTHTLKAIDDVAAVAFAPDGKSLAAADENGMLSVWDARTGERTHSMAFEKDFLLSLAYSPDGRSIAVAGKTRTIRLWDPVTGQELLTLEGHKGQVNGLAFSPDGSVLASCSHDGAVRLWRANPIGPLPAR